MSCSRIGLAAAVLCSCTVATASAADWGTLKGKITVDGSVSDPAAVNVNKDVEFCGKHDLKDETVVVGDGGGLANVVVYIYTKRNQTVEVNPDYEASKSEAVVLDNKGCRFEPHVLAARVGQSLEVKNSDEGIGHNTNIAFIKNASFNQTVPNDSPLKIVIQKAESYPVPVACNIHPWMKAYLVATDDPYVGITNEDGEFEIKDIPAGEHEFIFWHEAKGNMRDVAVGSGKTDRRGRIELEIPAGDTLDLGEIKVKPAAVGK